MADGDLAVLDVSPNDFLVLPENPTKKDLIQALQRMSPKNDFKLPSLFYRSDYLPDPRYGSISMSDADAAAIPLSYDEGYPTFDEGHLWWYQLPHEPQAAYELYVAYQDQANVHGLRQLQLLSKEQNIAVERLAYLYVEYYWSDRARAYDLFQIAADRKLRANRARRAEQDHFEKAGSILAKLEQYFIDNPEWVSGLSAREAIMSLVDMQKVQRMSLGLAANGNAGNTPIDPLAAATGADLMKEITKRVDNKDEGGGLGEGLAEAMMDPSFAKRAQEVVLRVRYRDPSGLDQAPTSEAIDAEFSAVGTTNELGQTRK